ncbi:Asparagine synthetase B [glutamine-hydrolyzing] [subsurface metagenome]
MCGILAIIGKADKENVQQLSKRQKHRGPDEWGMYEAPDGSVLSHERLSIIDLNTGTQPIQGTDSAWIMHNGEIYNHMELRERELKGHQFRTTCDSEVIVHLYEEHGYDFCNLLDGVFAFVLIDGDKFMAGRDPIGVKPMYYGTNVSGNMYFSSEMKAIADQCSTMEAFPPGHYYTRETGFVKFFNPTWEDYKKCNEEFDPDKLREAYYFRKLFEKYYPEEHSVASVLKWIPKWQKNADPSGRAAEIHFSTTEKY